MADWLTGLGSINFLPVQDLPCLIIIGNCQGNMKLTTNVINGVKPTTPINSISVYYNNK